MSNVIVECISSSLVFTLIHRENMAEIRDVWDLINILINFKIHLKFFIFNIEEEIDFMRWKISINYGKWLKKS